MVKRNRKEKRMKYYEVYLEPLDEDFQGVVKGIDEEDAEDNIEDESKGWVENFQFGLDQRGYIVKEISKQEYDKQVKYCKAT